MTSVPAHLSSIQALRGVAALAVAFLHFAGLQVEENIRAGLNWQVYGWMGVDMFFIISGFIMVWVTANVGGGVKTSGQFLAMRVIRIYPLWFVCMALLGIFFMPGNGIPASIHQIAKEDAWPFFIRSFFLIPQEMKPLISVGWTLIHEMFFYCVFAVFLAVGLRRNLPVGIAIWAAVTGLGLALGWGDISPALDIVFNPLSYLFMAGMGLALLIKGQDKPAIAKAALILGLILFAALFFTEFKLRSHRVLFLIVPFSLILYGIVSLEIINKRVLPRALTWLGDISYSVYLTHYLVIVGWRTFLKPFYPNGLLHETLAPGITIVIDTICLLIATLITATIFYHCVEKTSLKFLKSRLPNYRAPKP